jgi:hypothetical protein
MPTGANVVGTVISDDETPTFEIVRIKLKAGADVVPGMLLKIPMSRDGSAITLIARVRSAYEHNPNEQAESINVRDTLAIAANYPGEADSTIIYRQVEADLIEEFAGKLTRAPQTLPNSGNEVYVADDDEIVRSLGLVNDPASGLHLGTTTSGKHTDIVLRREVIQRHMFISGTTGSGKSYAMGVIAEEIIKHGIPMVFIDTQDEYSKFVAMKGGTIKEPGKDFTIRISSLSEAELLDLLPAATTELQRDIVTRAFSDLQQQLWTDGIAKFNIDDLLAQMATVGPTLTQDTRTVQLAINRTDSIKRHDIFGNGINNADWREFMSPCMTINCKNLLSRQLQSIATAVLRELQSLRLRGFIPPYVAVIDEAHLFVPDDESSPCKQIIREGVRIGRHHGIAMILMTQSPVDIDKRAIRQCNTRLVFALEPDQLSAIQGVKADASEEMLNALPKMPRGTCLLSGTYESVRHTIPMQVRERLTKNSEGGETPDIFKEMKDRWQKEIADLKAKKASKT